VLRALGGGRGKVRLGLSLADATANLHRMITRQPLTLADRPITVDARAPLHSQLVGGHILMTLPATVIVPAISSDF